MRTRIFTIVLVWFVPVLVLTSAPALSQPDDVGFRGWGPRVGMAVDPDQVYFGGHIDFGYFAEHFRLQPNVELGLGNDLTVLAINAETAYRFSSDWGRWSPYLGGGLGLISVSDDNAGLRDETETNLGASVLGGIEKNLSSGDRFFLEAKLGLVDAPDLKVGAGWTFF
jgi:opacity protein-like surface antigen